MANSFSVLFLAETFLLCASLLSFSFSSGLRFTPQGHRRPHSNKGVRQDKLSELLSYDLIEELSIDTSSEYPIVSFTSFDRNYEFELEPNSKMVLGNVRHASGIPSNSDGYISSLQTSCHYHVRRGNNLNISGSMSLCPRRGVRGRIVTLDDVLILRPASYYFEEEHAPAHFSDTHLIYKVSDYNGTQMDSHDYTLQDLHDSEDLFEMGAIGKKISASSRVGADLQEQFLRRKMMSFSNQNNGVNEIELFVIVDPTIYERYYLSYAQNLWYEELLADTAEYVNDASSIYLSTDWGADIGEISIHLVEFEVVPSFSGDYALLFAGFVGECDYDLSNPLSTEICELIMSNVLPAIETWTSAYKDTSAFDAAMMMSDFKLRDANGAAIGYAYPQKMCKTGNVIYSMLGSYSHDYFVNTIAHEVAHTLGISHDGSLTSCSENPGVMSEWGGTRNAFSSCSINFLQTHFQNNDMSCLGDGVRALTTSNSANSVVVGPQCHPYDCITTRGLNSIFIGSVRYILNGMVWHCQGSSYYTYSYYKATINGVVWYLRYDDFLGVSVISTSLSDATEIYAFCTSPNPVACGNGQWATYQSGTWKADPNTVIVPSCTDCNPYDCLTTGGLNSIFIDSERFILNGKVWYSEGCSDNLYPIYKTIVNEIDWYMRYDSSFQMTVISMSLTDGSEYYAYCDEEDPVKCDNAAWTTFQNGVWKLDPNTVSVSVCPSTASNRRRTASLDNNNETVWDMENITDISNFSDITDITDIADFSDAVVELIEILGSFSCSHVFDCVTLLNIGDLSGSYVSRVDGAFGCVYQNVEDDINSVNIYWDAEGGYWTIDGYARCTQADIMKCSGKWEIYQKNGVYVREPHSMTLECSDSKAVRGGPLDYSVSDDCSKESSFQAQVCISDMLGTGDTAVFEFDMCKNDAPVYYSDFWYPQELFLHFEGSRWIVSSDTIIDVAGLAYCERENLSGCSEGQWMMMQEDNDGDGVEYQVSILMTISEDCEAYLQQE